MEWTARWIWDDGDPNPWNYHLCFRRAFDLESVPQGAKLHITADTRYVLWINGQRIGHGPVRSWPWAWRYDTYDVAGHLLQTQRLGNLSEGVHDIPLLLPSERGLQLLRITSSNGSPPIAG